MQYSRPAATRLTILGALMLAVLLASLGTTAWIARTLSDSAATLEEAGGLRVHTWRIAAVLQAEPAQGADRTLSPELRDLADGFDRRIEALLHGDGARALHSPADPYAQQRLLNVASGWTALRREWIEGPTPAAPVAAAQAEMYVAWIDDFVGSLEDDLAWRSTMLQAAQTMIVVLSIGGAALLLVAGRRLVSDLRGPVQPDLRDARARLADHQRRLSALHDVGAFIAAASSLDELCDGFVKRVRVLAGADAAALRWADGNGVTHRRLLAGDRLPPGLADGDHCLTAGDCLCGHPELQQPTRVVPIRSDGAERDHCARAGLQTLVMVPVRRLGRPLGEIDLFFRDARVLGDEDRRELDLLADQLACAAHALPATRPAAPAAVDTPVVPSAPRMPAWVAKAA